jgi:hypothetical protein
VHYVLHCTGTVKDACRLRNQVPRPSASTQACPCGATAAAAAPMCRQRVHMVVGNCRAAPSHMRVAHCQWPTADTDLLAVPLYSQRPRLCPPLLNTTVVCHSQREPVSILPGGPPLPPWCIRELSSTFTRVYTHSCRAGALLSCRLHALAATQWVRHGTRPTGRTAMQLCTLSLLKYHLHRTVPYRAWPQQTQGTMLDML